MRVYRASAMADPNQPLPLTAASVEAIFAAAGRSAPFAPAMIEEVRGLLDNVLKRAVRQAYAKPITKDDVDRLDAAYRRFHKVIEELQDRDHPPPGIPVSHGSTDWEHWLIDYQHFGFKVGRRESSDWKLIASLIGLYEMICSTRASAAQAKGPTMRFLRAALCELEKHAPAEIRGHFASPTVEALKQQLPRLREFDIPIFAKALANGVKRAAG